MGLYEDLTKNEKKTSSKPKMSLYEELTGENKKLSQAKKDWEQAKKESAKKQKNLPLLNNIQNVINPVGNVASGFLDILNRPQQAIYGGVNALQKGKDVVQGVSKGITGKEQYSGGQILRNFGMSNSKGIGADDVLGFGIDTISDPTRLIPVGGAAKIIKANKKVPSLSKNALKLDNAIPNIVKESVTSQTPIRTYHGTTLSNGFDVFNVSKTGNLGTGIYLTADKRRAIDFSKGRMNEVTNGKVLTTSADIKNPIDVTKPLSKELFAELKQYLPKKSQFYGNELSDYKYDTENSISEINHLILKDIADSGVDTSKILSKNGFDGIVSKENGKIKDIVAFNPSQVKIQNNSLSKANVSPSENLIKPEYQKPIRYDEITEGNTKQRKFIKTAKDSGNLTKGTRKELQNIDSDYVIKSDAKSLEVANNRIENNGADMELNTLRTNFNNGQRFSKEDMVTLQRLYQEAQVAGDTKTTADIIADLAVLGTEQGQSIQALSLVNKLTPEGRLMTVERLVNRENSKLTDKQRLKLGGDIKVPQELKQKILGAKNQKELDDAVNEALTTIGNQIPLTASDKIRSWRYVSMLGNPRTHIRNIVSNTAMKGLSSVKNKLSGAIEDVTSKFIPKMERTKTAFRPNNDQLKFAKQDAIEMRDRIQVNNKYDIKAQTTIPMRAFDNKTLNKIAQGNSNALSSEDWFFSSKAYSNAMAKYMKSNNYTPEFLKSETKEAKLALEKGRQIATKEAQEQTFQQANSFANALSQFENKNAVSKVAIGATVPFKKTPLNIAKTGYEYSPIKLVKAMTVDFPKNVKSGKMTVNEAIDGFAKGLTGTSIMAIGAFMASQGIVRASGSNEDKEEYFQEAQGKQPYSIELFGKSYTLDWLSPSAMPFFAGVEAYNLATGKNENSDMSKLNSILEGTSKLMDPLTQMSMLQGLNSSLQSYNEAGSPFGYLGAVLMNTGQNYAGQFIPTISGQVARTTDDTRRTTTGGGKGIEKTINTFVNKQKAKIPGLENTLEPYTDIYGREQKTGGVIERAFQNFISPGYLKNLNTTKIDKEIQNLYDKTGEKSILPSSSQRYFTVDGKKIYLTPKEYTQFNKTDGKKVVKDLNNLFNTSYYKDATDEAKIKAIERIYRASQAVAKQQYIDKKGVKQ